MQDPTNPSSEAAEKQRALLEGARCAEHPELPAHAVCARCGNFMCATCSQQGRAEHCTQCRGRSGASSFPFSRDRFSLEDLIRYSWDRFKVQWLLLSLSSLVFLAVIYGIAFAGSFTAMFMVSTMAPDPAQAIAFTWIVQGVIQVAQTVVQMWLQLGFFALILDVLQGRDAEIGVVFSRLGRMPAAIVQILVIYAVIIVAAAPIAAVVYVVSGADMDRMLMLGLAAGAVILIPLSYVLLGMAFAMIELVHNPTIGAMAAIRASFDIVRGRRWIVLGTALVSGIVMFAGMLACCVGFIPSMALGSMIFASLYLSLRTPTPRV